MNIVKIFINLHSFQGKTKKYVHGISDSISATTKLSNAEIALWTSSGGVISNSESLIDALNDPRPAYVLGHRGRGGAVKVKVIDLLRDCVGVNRAYSEIYNVKEHFLQLQDIMFYSQRNKLCLKAVVDGCDDVIMAALVARGYNIDKLDELTYVWNVETSVRTTSSPTLVERHSLSKKMRYLGLWSYTDGEKYKLYVSPVATRMSSPSIIYHTMFFFGSITRYHPDLFNSILTAKEYWLVSEFLKTQPQQFLYYMLSYMNGTEVLYSKQV